LAHHWRDIIYRGASPLFYQKTKTPMAKSKTKDYIDELKGLVMQRNDGIFDPWLTPLTRSTAMNMVILDKLQEELENNDMTSSMTGSMGQQKIDVNPLLDKYDKTQNTLIKQFDALGLTAKGKGRNGTSDADDEDPVLAALTNR
jgi:hypothetical protein